MTNIAAPARYRFGDGGSVGVLLGISLRQVLPLVVGMIWLTLWLMASLPLIGLVGPTVGAVVSFGRWQRAPLYEVLVPAVRLGWRRSQNHSVWAPASLLDGASSVDDLPPELRGLTVFGVDVGWHTGGRSAAVVHDRKAGSVSAVVAVQGSGFVVASPLEQDGLVANWGAALAPLARAQCTVSRVTWQEWSHPAGISGHREFLASIEPAGAHEAAGEDYEQLLAGQEPFTVAHEVLVTVTVDLRRVRRRRGTSVLDVAIESLVEEVRQLHSRLEAAAFAVSAPLSRVELSMAIRLRSDPTRGQPLQSLGRSLASAAGHRDLQWGPMATQDDWSETRVDSTMHRSFKVAAWPMLPVTAEWLAPLLTGDGATRTVSVVMEPVALGVAAQDANRQLTSIEADHHQKGQHGFRLTATERRRHHDVEIRERELAEGHPLFRHVAIVTVSAPDLDVLDEASARVEQAAAQSMLDLRPLVARQAEGWVASLPLGRSVRQPNPADCMCGVTARSAIPGCVSMTEPGQCWLLGRCQV